MKSVAGSSALECTGWRRSLVPVLLFLVACALGGCEARDTPAPKAPSVARVPGLGPEAYLSDRAKAEIRIANGSDLQAIDPQITNGIPELRVQETLFEGLLRQDAATREMGPACAESYTLSADGRIWTFRLRPGLSWSNGDPLTAEDWVYSLRRAMSPALGAPYNYFYALIDGAPAYQSGKETDFSTVGVRALDALTLEIRLAEPAHHFSRLLENNAFYPVHRATIEAAGRIDQRGTGWDKPETFVGNGPYVLEEWRPNSHVSMRRNPRYRLAGEVRTERIVFQSNPDMLAAERAFAAGQVDIVPGVPPLVVERYTKEFPDKLRIDPFSGVYYLSLNTRSGPLADARLRRALALVIDREALVTNVLRSGQKAAYCFVPPTLEAGRAGPHFEEDVAEARRLLAEAGYPGGAGLPELEFLFNTSETHKQIAEALQQMWGDALGVRIRLASVEWKVFLAQRFSGNYQMARSGWIGIYEDPRAFLELFVTGGGNNDPGWSDPEYDSLLRKAASLQNPEARRAVYAEAEERLMRAMPIIPVYFYTQPILFAPDVRGFEPQVRGATDLRAVWRLRD